MFLRSVCAVLFAATLTVSSTFAGDLTAGSYVIQSGGITTHTATVTVVGPDVKVTITECDNPTGTTYTYTAASSPPTRLWSGKNGAIHESSRGGFIVTLTVPAVTQGPAMPLRMRLLPGKHRSRGQQGRAI